MGYVKEKVTEKITHDKTIGMKCDTCGSHTNKVDDDSWHGFHAQSYWYETDATDREYYTVCSPECFFKFIVKLLEENFDDEEIKIDDMEMPFLKKIVEFYKQSNMTGAADGRKTDQ